MTPISGDVVRPAEGLGRAGLAVWDGSVAPRPDDARLQLRADEVPLLAELCHLVDDVGRIRAELGDEFRGVGSKGQPVRHPLRAELHRSTARMESIAKTLRYPTRMASEGHVMPRALARRRWSA